MRVDRFESRLGAGVELVIAIGALALLLAGAEPAGATDGAGSAPAPECADGLDNDGDELIDHPEDPECSSYDDESESPATNGRASRSAATSGPGFQTYYESVVGGSSVAVLTTTDGELPSTLAIQEASAVARFIRLDGDGWELRIEGFQRNHERVDGIYDMVLVLPLPKDAGGLDAFTTDARGVQIEEGPRDRSIPLIYGGEKMVLKRNGALEKGLLPDLVGSGAGQLPSLEGTGYGWTAWNAIVARDASFASVVQARAILRYEAGGTEAPDAGDPRLAAYLITWIPALPASIPPYAVRIDVAGGGGQ